MSNRMSGDEFYSSPDVSPLSRNLKSSQSAASVASAGGNMKIRLATLEDSFEAQ